MNCSFCGVTFDEAEARSACDACLTSEGCARLRCPQCGYESPEVPAWLQRLRNWFRGDASGAADGTAKPVNGTAPGVDGATLLRLSELASGHRATVMDLERGRGSDVRKLLSLGVVPGATVQLERARPVVVFRLARTRLALDAELASQVYVRPAS